MACFSKETAPNLAIAKYFSDAGFRFLMKGIKETAPKLDLELIKLRYAEKWASGPNKTPGPQSLVD